jgi:hypothetical protein
MPPWTRFLRRPERAGAAKPPPHPGYTLVFLHVPKTAGLSLREVLLERNGDRPAFRIITPVRDSERLRALPHAEREALALVEGHLYYGIHELLPRPCVYVTMLRDPVERVLSYYSFVREWEPHHLHAAITEGNLSLAECIRRGLTVELDNFMVRCLTSLENFEMPFGHVTRSHLEQAKAHLDSFAVVGITEQFDRSLQALCGRFGWPRVSAPRLNATSGRLRRDDLSARDLDLVHEHNRLDAELYRYAAELLASRCRSDEAELSLAPPPTSPRPA